MAPLAGEMQTLLAVVKLSVMGKGAPFRKRGSLKLQYDIR